MTAIPQLLNALELGGCAVTIDAIGTQIQIADCIVVQGADYVLALKGKQGKLHEQRFPRLHPSLQGSQHYGYCPG